MKRGLILISWNYCNPENHFHVKMKEIIYRVGGPNFAYYSSAENLSTSFVIILLFAIIFKTIMTMRSIIVGVICSSGPLGKNCELCVQIHMWCNLGKSVGTQTCDIFSFLDVLVDILPIWRGTFCWKPHLNGSSGSKVMSNGRIHNRIQQ